MLKGTWPAAIVLAIGGLLAATAGANDTGDFARLPYFSSVKVSPNGDKLAALVSKDGQRAIYTLALGAERPKMVAANETWHLSWLDWVDNRYVLVGIKTEYRRGGVPTIERRLLSFDSETGDIKQMFKREETRLMRRGGVPPQIQDQVLQTLPEQDEVFVVLLSDNIEQLDTVYLANARTGSTKKTLKRHDVWVLDWDADRTGDVRVAFGLSRDKTEFRYEIKDAEGKWHDHSRRFNDTDFRVAALPTDGSGHVLVLSDHEHPLGALYRFDPASGEFVEQLAQHDASPISSVALNPDGRTIDAVYYSSEFVADEIRNDGLQTLVDAVRKAVPGLGLYPVSFSTDRRSIVFRSLAPDHPPEYYFFDADSKRLGPIASMYPELRERELVRPVVLQYEARDGLVIDAYVTLPPGVSIDDARELPFIVDVHGGPNARDFLRFDWQAQMLAARGYGVLQINFRGSTGYGRAFEEAGDREWGQAMQDDVTDGTQWLIDEGYADANRICLIGGSYGGYAALMGAAVTDGLYQCAASLNGVADLRDLLRRSYRYRGGRVFTRHIGRLWGDRKALKEVSPVNRVDDIGIPILLVHGEKDRVVDVQQSRDMAKALESRGKPVQFIELPDGTHSLERAENRQAYADALVAFLDRHLGRSGGQAD